MKINIKKEQPTNDYEIVGVAKVDGNILSTMVKKNDDGFEVSWAKSLTSPNDTFVFDDHFNHRKNSAVAFDCCGVAFYKIELPSTDDDAFEKMVRIQTQSKLPLPENEIEIAWQKCDQKGEQVTVMIAAARKNLLQNFVNNVIEMSPKAIILDCQAIVKVWCEFFGGNHPEAVILNIDSKCTKICMVEQQQLVGAASLDVGIENFNSDNAGVFHRFAQDLVGTFKMFGITDRAKVPTLILTDGSTVINEITNCLNSMGFDAKAILPEDGDVETYKYLLPIGVAMVALEPEKELNLFKNIYRPTQKKQTKILGSAKKMGIVFLTATALFLIMLYITDLLSLTRLEKKLNDSNASIDFKILTEKHKLRKEAALSRPDFLGLFKDISQSGKGSIKLTGFDFKANRKIVITGTADKDKQLYEFQKKLLSEKSISDVKIQSANKDSKSNKIDFSINFHYRNFTKKGAKVLSF